MNIQHVPLIELQRDFYVKPRGRDRFGDYLRMIVTEQRTAVDLAPLVMMNPMAREHVSALLDDLLAMDADRIAADAVAEAVSACPDIPGDYKAGMVVVDDAKGGWTNRVAVDFGHRFTFGDMKKFGWVAGILWSSEPASASSVREAIVTSILRLGYIHRHGSARTLRERMLQEGAVLRDAGASGPRLDPDDLAYTRLVLAPYLNETDQRANMECLYGDRPVRSLGFSSLGLSDYAGFALALHDACTTAEGSIST